MRELIRRIRNVEFLKRKHDSDTMLQQNVSEIEAMVEDYKAEYNSEAAIKERKAFYKDLQTIATLRKRAFYSGEPMDKYPLPWGDNNEKHFKPS